MNADSIIWEAHGIRMELKSTLPVGIHAFVGEVRNDGVFTVFGIAGTDIRSPEDLKQVEEAWQTIAKEIPTFTKDQAFEWKGDTQSFEIEESPSWYDLPR